MSRAYLHLSYLTLSTVLAEARRTHGPTWRCIVVPGSGYRCEDGCQSYVVVNPEHALRIREKDDAEDLLLWPEQTTIQHGDRPEARWVWDRSSFAEPFLAPYREWLDRVHAYERRGLDEVLAEQGFVDVIR